jgi:hypothetical protein
MPSATFSPLNPNSTTTQHNNNNKYILDGPAPLLHRFVNPWDHCSHASSAPAASVPPSRIIPQSLKNHTQTKVVFRFRRQQAPGPQTHARQPTSAGSDEAFRALMKNGTESAPLIQDRAYGDPVVSGRASCERPFPRSCFSTDNGVSHLTCWLSACYCSQRSKPTDPMSSASRFRSDTEHCTHRNRTNYASRYLCSATPNSGGVHCILLTRW